MTNTGRPTQPPYPDAAGVLGAARAAHQAGRWDEAETLYKDVLGRWPSVAAAHNGLGLLRHAQGRRKEAARHIRKAIALDGQTATYLSNLGMVLRELGEAEAAEAACRAAIRQDPDHAQAWLNLGNIQFDRADYGLARACYREAIRHQRDYAKAWLYLGRTEWSLGKSRDAYRAVCRSLKLKPTTEGLGLLLTVALDLRCADQALQIFCDGSEAALSRKGLLLKAKLLMALGRHGEAEAILEQLIAESPAWIDAWRVRAQSLDDRNRLEDAVAAFDRAISLSEAEIEKPRDVTETVQMKLSRSYVLLKQGDYENGWRAHYGRWDLATKRRFLGEMAVAEWHGQPLEGRHLVVATEAGLGDGIQFVRYIQLLKEVWQPACITLKTDAALVELFQCLAEVDRVVRHGDPVPDVDYFAMLMDAPIWFKTTVPTIPAKVPYLRVDGATIDGWQTRIRSLARGRFAVGVAWQGGRLTAHDHHRSFPLSVMAPLFDIKDVCWISLQMGFGSEQMAASGLPIHGLAGPDDKRSIVDTAALIMALDLVIVPDTMLAHLAGALAKPVWVPLPYRGEWRWLTDREDSPWYPTLRLFRQPIPTAWGPVMERMASALQYELRQRRVFDTQSTQASSRLSLSP